jgi:hypothetical protein
MQKLERFLPGFNHIICGKPPKTTFTQFEEKLRKLRQSTLSELASIFTDFIPAEAIACKGSGKNSYRKLAAERREREQVQAAQETLGIVPKD